MRIENSRINMSSSVNVSKKSGGRDFLSILSASYSHGERSMRQVGGVVEIRFPARVKFVEVTSKPAVDKAKNDGFIEVEIDEVDRRKMAAIQQAFQQLTGKRVRFHVMKNPQDIQSIKASKSRSDVSFASGGSINTADGRKIEFSVNLNLRSESIRADRVEGTVYGTAEGQARVDPLVINFDSPSVGLTDTKFSFDIDTDGGSEQISFLAGGSGFLAIDLNNDGKINNGLELFGPKTGEGFSELEAYDNDGNNWIDENDPVFERLRIWTKDANGNDTLFALGAKGIGAIYLGNVSTGYDITSSSGGVGGNAKETGIFVREDGSVGTVQDIDLLVS